MIRHIYRILIIIIIFAISTIVVSFESLIGNNIIDLAVNPINGNIAIPTSSEMLYSKVVLTDINLNELRSVPLDDLSHVPYFCSYSRDGSKIYVCIANMPGWVGDPSNEMGLFLVIDTITWNKTYYNLPLYPMKMFVPIQNNIVYISCGFDNGPILLKMDTSNGQIIAQVNNYGGVECCGLCMNQAETKIYVDGGTGQRLDVNDEQTRYSKLRVYDYNLNYLYSKELAPEITDIINGPSDKVYISHSEWDFGNDTLVTVIDTISDEIEYQFRVQNTGAAALEIDPQRGYLYLSIATLQEYYNETVGKNLKTLLPTNSVMRIDLSDWSYSMIQVANETIGPIALSPDGCRLYAAAVNTDSQKVYYVDLE